MRHSRSKHLQIASLLLFGMASIAAAKELSNADAVGSAIADAANYQIIHENQPKDWKTVMILSVVNGAAKQAANTGKPMTAADYVALINKTKNWLDTRAPENQTILSKSNADFLRNWVDALQAGPGALLPPVAAYYAGSTKQKIDILEHALDPTREAAAYVEETDREIKAKQFAGINAREAFDLALTDPEFAVAVNPLLRDLTKLDTTSTREQAQSLYPFIPKLSKSSQGDYNIDASDLFDEYESLLDLTTSATDIDISDLSLISDYQLLNVFPADPATNPSPRPPGNTDNPEQRQAQRQLALDAASVSISSISKLIALENPKLANQVSTVGGATVQVGEAISKYLYSAETMTSKATSLAGAALVGNIVGATVDVFSLFAGGSSPDADMMGQIQRLSQQIEELRQEMNERFDRVDASLNAIMTALNDNFAKIDYQQRVLNGDVHAIQASLLDLQAKLDRLSQYSFAWLSAISKKPLIESMNGCLGFRARTGADIDFLRYSDCENVFYSWAHDSSRDELWAGIAQPDYGADGIYPTFTNFPLSVDINYLAQYPAQSLQVPALTSVRLPNPNEWVLGVRAYLQLANEWPKWASQISSDRLNGLIQIGQSTATAMRNIRSVANGNATSPNIPLTNALLGKYTSASATLQNAIGDFSKTYVADPKFKGVKFWGGAHQDVAHAPNASTISAWCDGTAILVKPALVVPDGNMFVDKYFAQFDRAPFVFAEYMNLGSIDYCVDAWFENGNSKSSGSGEADVAIYARFNGVKIAEWYKRLTVWDANGNLGPNRFPARSNLYTIVRDNWVSCEFTSICLSGKCGYKAQFEGTATVCGAPLTSVIKVFPLDAVTTQNVIEQLNSILRGYQRSLYAQIADAFSRATPIQVAAQRLTGVKLLVQAYVGVGLVDALEANDYFRALLYGDQSIANGPSVQADFANLADADLVDTTRDELAAENVAMNAKSSALLTTLTGMLNLPNGTPRPLGQIDVMLKELNAFKSLKDAGALSFCNFDPSPSETTVSAAKSVAVVTVRMVEGCGLSPSSGSAWLHGSAVTVQPGQFKVSISVDANMTAAARSGVMILGDQLYRVMQDAGPAKTDPGTGNPAPTTTGDFDGDGATDLTVFRRSTGTWWLLESSSDFVASHSQAWGSSTDVPVPGDYDGDGKMDLGVYRPSTGYWYILLSSQNYTAYLAQQWGGGSADVPVAGDYDGDGKADLAVYRPSTGYWYILWSGGNYHTQLAQQWGGSTDVPAAGDYDGDGKADLAVYRPSTGKWYILWSGQNYTAYLAQQWGGGSTDVPVTGDYDGDGKADLVVYRGSTSHWYILLSSTNYATYMDTQWGIGSDVPVLPR